jgi:hypothetical protein
MTTKNIEFKATLNTSEMDQKIQALQQKLKAFGSTNVGEKGKEIYGAGSPMSDRAQKLQEQYNQRSISALRDEFNLRERLYRNQEKQLKEIDTQLNKTKMSEQERLKIEQERVKTQERLVALSVEQAEIAQKAKGMGSDLGGFKGTGVGQPQPPEQPQGSKLGQIVGSVVQALGVASILKAVQGAATQTLNSGSLISQQRGAIIGSFAQTSGVDNLLSGKGIETYYNQGLRQRALGDAQGAVRAGQFNQNAAIAAMPIAMQAGAAAGSFAGPIGTAIGGISAGIGSFASSGRNRAQALGLLRGQGLGQSGAAYDAETLTEEYSKNLEAQKSQDYFGQKSLGYLEGNRSRFLNAQRLGGMGDEQFRDRFNQGLFTTDERMSGMQAAIGAGGSTAQARGSFAGQGLALGRDYGLTSADQVLGSLSKTVSGQNGTSNEVVRRLLSEAVKTGLDTSTFARENEKYFQMSAEFISKSGAVTTEQMNSVASSMNQFTPFRPEGGLSQAEIDAGGFARNYMNEQSAGGGPARETLQIGSFQRAGIKGLKAADINSLMGMDVDKLKAGGEEIQAMMNKSGLDRDTFIDKVLEAKNYARNVSPAQDRSEENVKSKFQSANLDVGIASDSLQKMIDQEKDPGRKQQLIEAQTARGENITMSKFFDSNRQNLTQQQNEALNIGNLKGFSNNQVAGEVDQAKRPQGAFDTAREAEARGEQLMLQKAFSGEAFERYVGAANSAKNATMEMTEALENFIAAVQSGSTNINDMARKVIQTKPAR